MATTDALPPTPTPGPTGSPTRLPTTTPSPTATPTAPPVGGRGLTLQSGQLAQLTWRDGLQETAYVVLRWSPTSGFAFLPSPDPAQGLPGNATGYADGSSLPDATYCYVILPVGGNPPTYNNSLGISDLLCVYPRSGTGASVSDFSVRLDEGPVAVLNWSPPTYPAQYELVAMRFDGSPTRRIPLVGNTAGYTDDTQGQATCYEVVAQASGVELGRTDRLCAVPGITSFTAGPSGLERLRAALPGHVPFR